MKIIPLSFFFGFTFFCVFLAGFVFGVSLKVRFSLPSSDLPDRRELKCTCVPCLPDLYCMKCGHKSRDCPKLSKYFRALDNIGTNNIIMGITK